LEQGSPGEAVKVLDKGFQANVFADQRAKERNTRLLETAKKTAATDQANLPKIAAEADKAPTGAKNAGVGLAYLGYGQYDKAIDEFQKALTKGGLRNEAETRLQLGIAQFKAGHKDEAYKTWKTVKGDPVLERLAGLWAVHARQGYGLRPPGRKGLQQGRRERISRPSSFQWAPAEGARTRKERHDDDQGRRQDALGYAQAHDQGGPEGHLHR